MAGGRRGAVQPGSGGGIWIDRTDSINLLDNKFSFNETWADGGAVALRVSDNVLIEKEVPCPLLLRFYRIENELSMQVVFRSIDIVGGAVNDFYAFRALQNKFLNDLNQEYEKSGFSLDFGTTTFYLMDAHIREEDIKLVDSWIRRGIL